MIGHRGFFSVVAGTVALGLLAALPARAADGEFVRDAMSSIGLIEPERPAITYRERAPLVMPPALGRKAPAKKSGKGKGTEPPVDYATMPLPIPQTRQDDPQWPKDPEVSRRERAAIDDKKPIVRGAQGRMNDNNETLSAFEMEQGRREGGGRLTGPASSPGETRDATWLNPLALFTGRGEDAEPSAVEPERDGLTDPPTGYRKAPVKAAKTQAGPMGNSISGNEEADPRVFMRSQTGR